MNVIGRFEGMWHSQSASYGGYAEQQRFIKNAHHFFPIKPCGMTSKTKIMIKKEITSL